MKIGITGSSRGLGYTISKYYKNKKEEVFNYNRPEFNIDVLEQRKTIIQNIILNDLDVFINNAYSEYASQNYLLDELFKVWVFKPKTIINISSNTGNGTKDFVHPYAAIKTGLDSLCDDLFAMENRKCRVVNLRPGYMDTKRVQHIDAPKMSTEEVVKIIDYIITQPQHVNIGEIEFTTR